MYEGKYRVVGVGAKEGLFEERLSEALEELG